jgi:hypothetical protein
VRSNDDEPAIGDDKERRMTDKEVLETIQEGFKIKISPMPQALLNIEK